MLQGQKLALLVHCKQLLSFTYSKHMQKGVTPCLHFSLCSTYILFISAAFLLRIPTMELYGNGNLWSLVEEERRNMHFNRSLSFTADQNVDEPPESPFVSPKASSVSAASIPLSCMSPETPWKLSPVHAAPSPSLRYHCLASLHRYEGNVFSIAISRDFIFTGSESSRIHTWRRPDCAEVGHVKASSPGVRAILAHGSLLFTTHADCKVRVWDVSVTEKFRPKKITTLPKRNSFMLFPKRSSHHHGDHISCVAYNHGEKLLYTGSWDKTVKVWNILERQCVDSFLAHEGQINAMVINQQDGCVFTCSSDGAVKIWRRVYRESSHILTMTLKFQLSPVNALALSSLPNSCFLYSGSSDGLINFWEKEKTSGRFNHCGFLQGHHFAVLCLATINELILSGSEDATIRVWRREAGHCFHSCLAVMDGHHGPVRCLAVSLEIEGLLIYSASLDRSFKVWRVKLLMAEKAEMEEVVAANDQQTEIEEFEMSPVLSPSWVKKKIQANHFQG